MVGERSENVETRSADTSVSVALRRWFILHFVVDVVIAVPIFFAPREVLGFFGWVRVDPLAARLAAAALFGIGIESFMGRNAGRESFKGMLQLKIIWSAFATIATAGVPRRKPTCRAHHAPTPASRFSASRSDRKSVV